MYLQIINWKPLCAVLKFGWVNKCSVVTTGLWYTGMNNYSSQAVGHCMTWNFQSWLLQESINCSIRTRYQYTIHACQYSQPPYTLVSTHNHHTYLSLLTITIHACKYVYWQHIDSKNNVPALEHWGGGFRAGWHVRCTLNMDTKELWQRGEAVSLPFGHIPVASEHACKDSSKQSVHTWPVRNSSKECTHHSYK